MNNYIIWNGRDSRDLEGLIICELPPITKPKMRIETTEIDGKDGDILENIGYSSYAKTLKIGLTKDYDINEIIEYFTGKGEVVFSNEPDKYYVCEIFDEINFERLVRFKTADVNFHTQPFKYLLNEQPITLEINDETELEVTNAGLQVSKPIITLFGDGIVTISINDHAIFEINIDDEFVVIDSEKEEAYKGNILKNRSMVGKFPTLNSGSNIITWVGNLERIEVLPKSRWL